MAQLVEVVSITGWVIGFFIHNLFLPHYGPVVKSASKRDISWWVGLTTLPSTCADCPEILGASTSWGNKDLSIPVMGEFYKSSVPVNMV